jgi:hypothetical protein
MNAAVHGVDPEAVEEAKIVVSASFTHVSCVYEAKARTQSSRYPITCPRDVRAAHCFLALSNAPTQVNGHEKIYTPDY